MWDRSTPSVAFLDDFWAYFVSCNHEKAQRDSPNDSSVRFQSTAVARVTSLFRGWPTLESPGAQYAFGFFRSFSCPSRLLWFGSPRIRLAATPDGPHSAMGRVRAKRLVDVAQPSRLCSRCPLQEYYTAFSGGTKGSTKTYT